LPLPSPPGDGRDLGAVRLFEAPLSTFAEGRRIVAERPPDWFQHARLGDGSDYLCWTDLFEFLVSADGAAIACRALDGATLESFQTYLLGHVLSFALLKLGIEPLHATAVAIDGTVAAFVGDCGRGKSTLAAAFLASGCALVTDDLLVVEQTGSTPLAFPGPPRIKLFPEVARVVLGAARGVPMHPATAKLVIPLAATAPRHPLPLGAVYVLAPASSTRRDVAIRSLSRRQALLALIANTFNTVIIEPARLARQLDAAAALVAGVAVKALAVPRGLERLLDVREAIRADLAA
jgi:hypothetical protein